MTLSSGTYIANSYGNRRGTFRASTSAIAYRLKIQQLHNVCFFQLTWGISQQLSAALAYPKGITTAYEEWRRAYLSFYNKSVCAAPELKPISQPESGGDPPSQGMSSPEQEKGKGQLSPFRKALAPRQSGSDPKSPMRGRVAASGRLKPVTNDRQARLAKAEANLLHQFQRWLRSSELYEIRAEIARAAREAGENADGHNPQPIDLVLTCSPTDLERLPWETWEIGEELSSSSNIRISRCPLNVRREAFKIPQHRKSRMRVLAIMGDDRGLDFEVDRKAVSRLAPIADIQYLGYRPGISPAALKADIVATIDDDRGWDILFFAGHSTEADIVEGDLSIAPNAVLSIKDLVPYLQRACKRGLQFAIFNSCSGLGLARTCIDAGLSQVAIAREPIHNQVAQEFLVCLLQQLSAGADAHDAVRAASRWFKLEKNFTYPSAYLLPSFFRHPDTALFQLESLTLQQKLVQLLPNRSQAIVAAVVAIASLLPGVQDGLLQNRTFAQAVYRDVTGQVPATTTPPVLLVQIERESIARANMADPYPMDRQYLARLVERLSAAAFPTIGIDYLLDRPQANNDEVFANSVRQAVEERGSWMVLAAISRYYSSAAARDIAPLEWTLRGDIFSYPNYIKLPWRGACYEQTCPFAYVLALSYTLSQEPLSFNRLVPHPSSDAYLQAQLVDTVHSISAPGSPTRRLANLHKSPITEVSNFIGQLWMQPILDFSLPSDLIYETVPAWQVLSGEADFAASQRQIALIAPGGYTESGIGAPDYYDVPAAMEYWRNRQGKQEEVNSDRPVLESEHVYTGAEAHAYSIHHLLKGHLVIPIPDLWMVGLALLGGKCLSLWMIRQRRQSPERMLALRYLGVGSVAYTLIGLQLYISAAVVLPIILPSLAIWTFALQSFRRTLRD